jgi:hypothetical protein
MSGGRLPWVPFMLDQPEGGGDLRDELGIPRDAVVFGRYGGSDTFDIGFVHEAVKKVVRKRPDAWFLFMNTQPFCEPHPRVVHLPGTADRVLKARFVDTCDAMLHARRQGESFGLAIAEFSARNRPVITYLGGTDRAHIEQLGAKGIYYETRRQLVRLLLRFEPEPDRDWDAYSREFAPAAVMRRFADVFLS